MKNNGKIIDPYGGELVNLLVSEGEREEWLDKEGNPTHNNAQITAEAIKGLTDENFKIEDILKLIDEELKE